MWQEYTEELYKKDLHDPDNHDGVITHLEPDILKFKVKWSSGRITRNKASGGDGIPGGWVVKNSPAMHETWVQTLGQEDPLQKEAATRSSILAWRIPGTEKPGGLQSIELQGIRHNWATKQQQKGNKQFGMSFQFLIWWLGRCWHLPKKATKNF